MTKNMEPPIEVGLLCFPGCQATSVHGLTDLFTYANHYAEELGAAHAPLRIRHWHHDADGTGMSPGFDTHPGTEGDPAIVVVPGSQLGPITQGSLPLTADWLRSRHGQGAVLAAVCGGVFLLAETGLLERRPVTTHWQFADELRRRFPTIMIDSDRLVIDDGDIITAGGVLAWANLGLTLVGRLLGPSVLTSTARFMLIDPAGKEQRFYSDFTPELRHGDRVVLAVQHWLQTQTDRVVTVDELAKRAVLGERTFLRRFTKATGMRPIEYHLRLRISRSQQMLEHTTDSVEQIAIAVGYEDAGGFRRLFKRIVGLSPVEYRRRFGHVHLRAAE